MLRNLASKTSLFKNNYLTDSERHDILKLQNEYIHAILERCKDPYNFDANIICLQETQRIFNDFEKILAQHLEKNRNKQYRGHSHILGREISLKLKVNLNDKIDKETRAEALKLLLPKAIKNLVATELANYPKLILEYPTPEENEVRDDQLEGNEQNYAGIFRFFDHTNIALHSIFDQTEIKQARKKFNEKIDELASGHENKPNM